VLDNGKDIKSKVFVSPFCTLNLKHEKQRSFMYHFPSRIQRSKYKTRNESTDAMDRFARFRASISKQKAFEFEIKSFIALTQAYSQICFDTFVKIMLFT